MFGSYATQRARVFFYVEEASTSTLSIRRTLLYYGETKWSKPPAGGTWGGAKREVNDVRHAIAVAYALF